MSTNVLMKYEGNSVVSLAGLSTRLKNRASTNIRNKKVVLCDEDLVLTEDSNGDIIEHDFTYDSYGNRSYVQLENFDDITDGGRKVGQRLGKFIAINADDSDNERYDNNNTNNNDANFAFVSFECIKNLWNMDDVDDVEIIAFTAGSRITFPKLSREKVAEYISKGWTSDYSTRDDFNNSTKAMFSDVSFHKSGNALVRYKGEYGIFGFDDGQYFGCLLPDSYAKVSPKNCDTALAHLRPSTVSNYAQRQGEWFFDPVDVSKVPDTCAKVTTPTNERSTFKDKNGVLRYSDGTFAQTPQNKRQIRFNLPLDDPNSNEHFVYCEQFAFNENGDCFLYDFKVMHSEHETITNDNWCRVVKNTAVRSVSVEGVD